MRGMNRFQGLRSAIAGGLLLMATIGSCGKSGGGGSNEQAARAFIARHLEQARPLEKTANLAWWQANTTGKEEDFKAKEGAENALNKLLSNPTTFQELKAIRDKGGIGDELVN